MTERFATGHGRSTGRTSESKVCVLERGGGSRGCQRAQNQKIHMFAVLYRGGKAGDGSDLLWRGFLPASEPQTELSERAGTSSRLVFSPSAPAVPRATPTATADDLPPTQSWTHAPQVCPLPRHPHKGQRSQPEVLPFPMMVVGSACSRRHYPSTPATLTASRRQELGPPQQDHQGSLQRAFLRSTALPDVARRLNAKTGAAEASRATHKGLRWPD